MNSASTSTRSAARPVLRLPNDRWTPLEIVFWLMPVAAYFVFPDYLVLISQIMIVGLFAVSLDLILGYAGIVSLGHAASSAWVPTRPACWPSMAGASRSRGSCWRAWWRPSPVSW
jgi:hypothetical protein